ncbi:MAG: AAA family ATPase [Parcubacteria group bacterium]|nr:AAA family ATPase [Parcubacteria group bacterium]
MHAIPTIVLTGGPCAGKTTALSHVTQWLVERGYTPLTIPETATLLMQNGFSPRDKGVRSKDFQRAVLSLQAQLEKHVHEIALSFPRERRVVVICDRGRLDAKAYTKPNEFVELLKEFGWSESSMMQSYKSVIHLRTSAIGAPEHYTLANNAARLETPEEAIAADERTLHAWLGHPHLQVIGNERCANFEEKLSRVKKCVAHALGIPEPLEIERKFLVDSSRFESLPVPSVCLHITQTYLAVKPDGAESRVRATTHEGHITYTHTTKRFVRMGIRTEEERTISKHEYLSYIRERNLHKYAIEKKRYAFVWENQYFELDVFVEPRGGLVLLEAELTDLQDTLILPDFIPIVREVTDDPTYTNSQLARMA